jgi:hypothetical protein
MNYRLNKSALYGVLLLVLLAAGIFGYTLVSAPTTTELIVEEDSTDVVSDTPASVPQAIVAQHQFVGGMHTIAGSVDLPTPCHNLLTEPFFVGEDTSTVEVRFTTSVVGDVCAQVITPARFKLTFEADENATITALWNGRPAELNLVPVPEGANLDDFEVYVKG